MIELLQSLAWGLGGFGVGYYLGRTAREVHEIKETIMSDETETPPPREPEPAPTPAASSSHESPPEFTAELVRRDALPWVGWILILLAVVFVAQGVFTQVRAQGEQAERAAELRCLSVWAEDFSVAIDARTASTSATNTAQYRHDQAIDDVLLHVLAGLENTAEVNDASLRRVLADFRRADRQLDRARRANERVRSANQFPNPPSVCIQ